MNRSYPPPRYAIAVAAAVTAFAPDEAGWRTVSDAEVRRQTGYRQRTVELAWQRLADLGAAEVGRASRGIRLVRPLPHHVWDYVRAYHSQKRQAEVAG